MSASAVRSVEALVDSSVDARGARGLIVSALALLGAVALLAALAPSAGALPPDRAYEKVSPNDKDGADIFSGIVRAAAGGGAVTYSSTGAFADSQGSGVGNQYVSERTPSGWTVDAIAPPLDPAPQLGFSQYDAFSGDLATGIVTTGDPPVDGATSGTQNIYRRNPDGSRDLLTLGQPVPTGFPPSPFYAGASTDLGLVGFDYEGALAVTGGPAPPADEESAYASDGTDLRLVSVLPDGTAVQDGATIGGADFDTGEYNAISDDGSRVFWSTTASPTEVYARTDPTTGAPATVWASESQRTPPDPGGPQSKSYQYATPDGDFVYFTSGEKLTNGSQATSGAPDLYRYNVQTGALVDLTDDEASGAGAGVLGVLGVSDSGGRVYFAATGDLAANVPPPPEVPAGQPKLYLRDGGETTFIAALEATGFPDDSTNWETRYGPATGSKTSRVTADGRYLLFSSLRQQGGYDNAGFRQFYLYDAEADAMACVSCNPSGAAATGDAQLLGYVNSPFGLTGLPLAERRNLLADGTVFFGSPESLLFDQDSNEQYDVYMWRDGRLSLISTGQSADNSVFVAASADGSDVFFLTRQQLVAIDTDDIVDIYDARVGGGIASQNPPLPPAPCEGDGCKPPAPPQVTPASPASAEVNNPPRDREPDCSSLESRAEKKAKKARKAKKHARKAHKQAKKAKRKARKASGKKAKRLKKKATKAKKKAKKTKKKQQQKKKKAKKAKKKAKDCKRGQD